jgi:hypothetical protein
MNDILPEVEYVGDQLMTIPKREMPSKIKVVLMKTKYS